MGIPPQCIPIKVSASSYDHAVLIKNEFDIPGLGPVWLVCCYRSLLNSEGHPVFEEELPGNFEVSGRAKDNMPVVKT